MRIVAVAVAVAALAASVAHAAAMRSVKVIQARVQGDQPEWNEEHGTFVSSFGRTFAEKYRAVFDSVNTASVEGALMYVQAEGINVQQNTECRRKNSMQYIVFYELHILQPDAALKTYEADASTLPEYSPFVAMDGGACTPASDGKRPRECSALYGGDNVDRLGPSVGASMRDTDARAPYPHAVWFSFPNSCVREQWAKKDSPCRQQFTGGLCGYGSQPDGEICTFTYKALGYINIDDLTGVTFLTNSQTKQRYTNYTEFCLDKTGEYKGIEFSVEPGVTDNSKVTSLPFWKNPFDAESNRERTQKMVELYNQLAENGANHMSLLPSPETLALENPPCYLNSKRCADAQYGCKRELYAQICRVCGPMDVGCSVKGSFNMDTLQGSDAGVDTGAGHVVARNVSDLVALDDYGNPIES